MKSGEIQTNEIIADALMNRKRVFIPKITGAESHNMVMVEIFSTEEVESFPKSKWGIPEPQLSENFIDVTKGGGVIDLVIVPGTGFDRVGCRLGHGRGYYDTFLETLATANAARQLDGPKAVGLSLNCQMVQKGEIPMEKHDRRLDLVVSSLMVGGEQCMNVTSSRDAMMDELVSSSSSSDEDASSQTLLVRGCDPVMAEGSKEMLPPLLGNVRMTTCTNDDEFFSYIKVIYRSQCETIRINTFVILF